MTNGDHFGAYGDPPSPSEIRTKEAIERMEDYHKAIRELILAARDMNNWMDQRSRVLLGKALEPFKNIK